MTTLNHAIPLNATPPIIVPATEATTSACCAPTAQAIYCGTAVAATATDVVPAAPTTCGCR